MSKETIFEIGAVGAIALYIGHEIIRTKAQFEPRTDNINLLLLTPRATAEGEAVRIAYIVEQLKKGIAIPQALLQVRKKDNPALWSVSNNLTLPPDEANLFMYSRGNSDQMPTRAIDNFMGALGTPRNGGGVLETYRYIRENIIHGPCVTFDYFDSQGSISFGQDNEKEVLEVAYNETVSKNPHADIIYIGLCRGGRLGLDLASERPQNLSAMILESPFISFHDATYQIGRKHFFGAPGSGLFLYNFFRYWFPSYDPAQDSIMHKLKNIPADLPILIGHLKGDIVISEQILYQVLQELKGRNHIYLIVVEDQTKKLFHGKLSETKPFQLACNAFLAHYGKPHNSELAQQGQSLLEDARANAEKTPEEWKVAVHLCS